MRQGQRFFRFRRKFCSGACSRARRWRGGFQRGGTMADVTARSLQYEYKAVSAGLGPVRGGGVSLFPPGFPHLWGR